MRLKLWTKLCPHTARILRPHLRELLLYTRIDNKAFWSTSRKAHLVRARILFALSATVFRKPKQYVLSSAQVGEFMFVAHTSIVERKNQYCRAALTGDNPRLMREASEWFGWLHSNNYVVDRDAEHLEIKRGIRRNARLSHAQVASLLGFRSGERGKVERAHSHAA